MIGCDNLFGFNKVGVLINDNGVNLKRGNNFKFKN
jgi:hypothetical protein